MLSRRAFQVSLPARRRIEPPSRFQSIPRRLLATIESASGATESSSGTIESTTFATQSSVVETEDVSTPISKQKKLKKAFPKAFPVVRTLKFSPTTLALQRDKKYAHVRKASSVDPKLLEFRLLVNEGQYSQAMQLYPMIMETSTMTRNDTLFVAKLLHNAFRVVMRKDRKDNPDPALPEKDNIHGHMQTLVADLKMRKLPSHPVADVHVLSYFKESRQYDEGAAFWKWLVEQDDCRLDPRSYGAAIELLAFKGEPLKYLEELYKQALRRAPGQFSEYHLSPGSIIANPSARTYTPGSKMLLLQGILTARILHGDWLNSYLTLDTALRLHPDELPTRFFDLFIYERPLPEAYTVFQIACRSGTISRPRPLMFLMDQLGIWCEQRPRDSFLSFKQRQLCGMLGMVDAVCSYLGVGGELDAAHMNKIIHEMLKVLSSAKQARRTPLTAELERLDGGVLSAVRSLIDVFGKCGINPNVVTFNTIVGAATRLQRPDLFTFCQEHLQPVLELKIKRVFNRYALKFAKTIEEINAAWEDVLSSDYGDSLDQLHIELDTLINVCAQTDNLEFAREQVARLKADMTSLLALRVNSALVMEQTKHAQKLAETTDSQKLEESTDPETPEASDDLQSSEETTNTQDWDASKPWSGLKTFVSQLAFRVEKLRSIANSKKPHNFQKDPISLHLETSPERKYNDKYVRQLYKVVTTDPNWTDTISQEKDLLKTGFTLAELRYQNWREINELLLVAEVNHNMKVHEIDRAITNGRPVEAEMVRGSIGAAESEAKLRIIEKRGYPLYRPDVPLIKGLTMEQALSPHKPPKWIQNVIRLRNYEGKIPPYSRTPEATLLTEDISESSLADSPESPVEKLSESSLEELSGSSLEDSSESPLEGNPQAQIAEDGKPQGNPSGSL